MLASAQWFFTLIIPQIFHFIHEQAKSETRPISSFIITGHSLGAGTAALLTMMVADHLEELRRLADNPDFKVHCYSYAPVASVSLDLSEKYKDYIDSFVCQDDIVARLSYGTASCSKELIMDATIAIDGMGGTSKINADSKARKACFEIIEKRRQEIFNAVEPKYPLLYVPGRVYHFRRRRQSKDGSRKRGQRRRPKSYCEPSKGEGLTEPAFSKGSEEDEEPGFSLHKSSPHISEEMYISKTCLEDHMLVTYLKAFQAVRRDCMRALHKRQPSPTKEEKEVRCGSPVPCIRVENPEGEPLALP